MKKTTLHKLASLWLALLMCLSLASPAFASEAQPVAAEETSGEAEALPESLPQEEGSPTALPLTEQYGRKQTLKMATPYRQTGRIVCNGAVAQTINVLQGCCCSTKA